MSSCRAAKQLRDSRRIVRWQNALMSSRRAACVPHSRSGDHLGAGHLRGLDTLLHVTVKLVLPTERQ